MKRPLLTGFLVAVLVVFVTPVFAQLDEDRITSVEERRILVDIEEQQEQLSARERELEAKDRQLKTLEAEVDKKLADMQQLRDELTELLDRRDEVENERLAELSLIYERMNPQQAAVLLSDLDTQMAVNLLLGIKKKTAGQIMERLDAEIALKISLAFTDMSVNDFP